MQPLLSLTLRRFRLSSAWLYNLRILLALTGTTLVPFCLQQVTWTIPLTLGVVAAALADLDDRLSGRLKNLIITLICFCAASVSVELLYPWPWLFFIGLGLSTWGFILLGALGQRYATIAFGALLIALYTLLGVGLFSQWYFQPLLLLLGAAWYNLLTLCGHLLFPVRPLQENLASTFIQLSHYLEAKAGLFDPDAETGSNCGLIDVAMTDSQLVAQLNITKASVQSRLRGDQAQRGTQRSLHYYFAAQDIHERASSSHVQYDRLRDAFRHSDILFRFQRVLTLQAKACSQLAEAILLRRQYQHDPRFEAQFNNLRIALAQLDAHAGFPAERKAMHYLLNNLLAIDAQLATIESERRLAQPNASENQLPDEGLTGWHDIRLRVSRHLSPASPLFRHAVRMSLLLCCSYAAIQLTGMKHGYWILLTSLFVCQPNYNATKHRLSLRIAGTIAGILIGLPVLWMVPSVQGQLLLIVLSGVLFFAFRTIQYAHATMFITLLVLLCFNLLGEGYEIALPRIIDTLIGCAIAWMAVSWIWPDWRFRDLPSVIRRTLDAHCRYLDAILVQYHQGKDNRVDYRIARRQAHNAAAELATVIANRSGKKAHSGLQNEEAFRLLCLCHSLLSYISALGAHREKIEDEALLLLLDDAVCYVDDALQPDAALSLALNKQHAALFSRIETLEPQTESSAHLILQQILLLLALLPELTALQARIIAIDSADAQARQS
ncbi:TIGR01666 family membrane protein [Erwinia sp. OLTSP20]|uniref:YccS family putative transporter n=1 Tax=unclassified Erwinia TaxID=2622719 RepID=UPI000C17B268|nr:MULTISPECIES: YccS family putative transporter [unclassified Erwinia]PIJ51356.1 TIGR01666 family membrane protein [Erwinia sp. OAMSP11]PIJ74140.1 TIGR01666 family membrane protein [Erwinia sp. OLSSP12]PIJ81570.1 TIGR01666 family membrane protein [Erwinia sp. OLCASP19]PIJ86103.1 TIGR01666 family membrane protein [Erwinia sp. OLMTSP26]PIJ87851.1 TIGR01666 family membrane protein [Erwinia sp. OLMDSP33]